MIVAFLIFVFLQRFRRVGYAIITKRNRVDDIKTDETGRVVDEDLLQFIDLVTKCLDLDPETRITPAEALRHLFCQKLLKTAKSGGEKSAATEGMADACASLSASLAKEGSGSSSDVAASEDAQATPKSAKSSTSKAEADSSVASSKSKGGSSTSSKSGK
jgi:serine/threonine protein kinase